MVLARHCDAKDEQFKSQNVKYFVRYSSHLMKKTVSVLTMKLKQQTNHNHKEITLRNKLFVPFFVFGSRKRNSFVKNNPDVIYNEWIAMISQEWQYV